MKPTILTGVVWGTVLALTWLATRQQAMSQDGETDLKNLQGTWILESFDGKRPETVRRIRFEGDKVVGLFRDEKQNALTLGFRLLPERERRGIDVGPFPEEYKGFVIRGVYHLEGDVLKFVFQPKLDARRPPPGYDIQEARPKSLDPKLVKVEVWRRYKEE